MPRNSHLDCKPTIITNAAFVGPRKLTLATVCGLKLASCVPYAIRDDLYFLKCGFKTMNPHESSKTNRVSNFMERQTSNAIPMIPRATAERLRPHPVLTKINPSENASRFPLQYAVDVNHLHNVHPPLLFGGDDP